MTEISVITFSKFFYCFNNILIQRYVKQNIEHYITAKNYSKDYGIRLLTKSHDFLFDSNKNYVGRDGIFAITDFYMVMYIYKGNIKAKTETDENTGKEISTYTECPVDMYVVPLELLDEVTWKNKHDNIRFVQGK